MSEPSIILGIPLMDRDHAVLESLLARVTETDDTGLIHLLDEIEAETRAHFHREEEMMREYAVSVLTCHAIQHEMLVGQIRQARGSMASKDAAELRHFIGEILPALLLRHINIADRVTAGLLRARTLVDI